MANIKFNIKNLPQVEAIVHQRFNDIIKGKAMLKEIAEFSRDRAFKEGKKGTPLNDKRKFPDLKASTKRNRDYLSKLNKTDRFYKKDKSNLTFTGQLWRSLQYDITRNVVKLFFRGKRKPYKTGAKRSAKKTPISNRNDLLAKALAEKGFIALGMDDKGKQRIRNIALKHIRKALKLTNNILR